MEKKLVFDIGMHTGQDTINYLKKGYRVIAVEASPILVEINTKLFKKYIDDKSLIILNIGISDKEGILPFYINLRTSEWSSFSKELGSRNNTPYEVKDIKCVPTTELFKDYGIPHFLKVDIEGYDFYCVNDLPVIVDGKGIKYISCESADGLLDTLYEKGYRKFKLINQAFNFIPLNMDLERKPYFPLFLEIYNGIKLRVQKVINLEYPYSSSGPMPEESKGPWLDYETIKKLYDEFHHSNGGKPVNNKSWFDIHATY